MSHIFHIFHILPKSIVVSGAVNPPRTTTSQKNHGRCALICHENLGSSGQNMVEDDISSSVLLIRTHTCCIHNPCILVAHQKVGTAIKEYIPDIQEQRSTKQPF